MKDIFLGKRLFLITAHPDDESYTAAGTIYKNYQQGGRVGLLCATFGEKGRSHMKKRLTLAQMKKIRKREMRAVAKFLHIAPVQIIGIPDGKVKKNVKKFYNKGLEFAEKYKPQAIISFGLEGISGHHDHIAAGRVALKISRKLKLPLYTFTLSPRITMHALRYLKTRRQAKHYSDKVRYKKPSIKININPKVKKKALRLHKSQMDRNNAFTGFPEFAVKEFLKAEYFTSS